jgi:hypothetical protein
MPYRAKVPATPPRETRTSEFRVGALSCQNLLQL